MKLLLGIARFFCLTLQTSGSVKVQATGETRASRWSPNSMAGTFQCSGTALVRYHYPICEQMDLYGEARYNISFNRFEKAYAGYHDAYGLTLGVCYKF